MTRHRIRLGELIGYMTIVAITTLVTYAILQAVAVAYNVYFILTGD